MAKQRTLGRVGTPLHPFDIANKQYVDSKEDKSPQVLTHNATAPNVIPDLIFLAGENYKKILMTHTGYLLQTFQNIAVDALWEIRDNDTDALISSVTSSLFINPSFTHLPFLATIAGTDVQNGTKYKLVFVSITTNAVIDQNDTITLTLF